MVLDPAYRHGAGRLAVDWTEDPDDDSVTIILRDPWDNSSRILASLHAGEHRWTHLGDRHIYRVDCLELGPRKHVSVAGFRRRHVLVDINHDLARCWCVIDKSDPFYGARKARAVQRLKTLR